MAYFVARIELLGPEPQADCAEQYAYLASCMAVQGFSDTLTGNKPRLLPTGTFLGRSDLPLSGVLAAVSGAVQRAGLKARIVVFPTSTLVAKNLASPVEANSTFTGMLHDES